MQPAAPADEPVFVRFAESEQDITAIHEFLLEVAGPRLEAPVLFMKSLREIVRVVQEEAALMLFKGDKLVGTMGIIKPTWWYADADFMCDRWHFCLPEVTAAEADLLLQEAIRLAETAFLKFYHQGKIRPGKRGIRHVWPRRYGVGSYTVQPETEEVEA